MGEDGAGRPLPLPSFLIVGAQKSGTRWLRHNLCLHDEIYVAERELEFFNTDAFERDCLEGYSRRFEHWRGERIVGEATPGYMMLREDPAEIAERIDDTLPDVRLIAILRNPVDRIRSAILHHSQRGRLPASGSALGYLRSMSPAGDPWGIVVGSWYAASLAPYVDRFGERLLVLLHDDIATDPAGLYREACAHVGASTDVVPPGLGKVRFSNRREEATDAEVMRDELSDGERAVLMGYVRDEIDALEELLDLDLSRWRLGARFTPELRADAMRRVLWDGALAGVVAAEMSIPATLLESWCEEAVARMEGGGS